MGVAFVTSLQCKLGTSAEEGPPKKKCSRPKRRPRSRKGYAARLAPVHFRNLFLVGSGRKLGEVEDSDTGGEPGEDGGGRILAGSGGTIIQDDAHRRRGSPPQLTTLHAPPRRPRQQQEQQESQNLDKEKPGPRKGLFETLDGMKGRRRSKLWTRDRSITISGSGEDILAKLRLQPRTVKSYVAIPTPKAFNLTRRMWRGDPVCAVAELSLLNGSVDSQDRLNVLSKLPDGDSRVIVIGDVHGCLDELQRLLKLANFLPGDQVVFLGDLVAKGPASVEVVQLAREINALSCRGNHDHKVISYREMVLRSQSPDHVPKEHQQIAESLSDEDHQWLLRCPWIIQFPEMSMIFVHAGVDPNLPLAEQRPHMLMNMRSVAPSGKSTTRRGLESWAKHWHGPEFVVFGHDASRGIQRFPKAYGLDSACVHGGWLTALVLPEKRLISVPARRKYRSMMQR